MKILAVTLPIFFTFFSMVGQETIAVKAKDGDGIYSILRKQGLNPVKYYETFLKLNKKNIKNGSELYLGRTYYVPNADDSFKNTALRVTNQSEISIFDKELAHITAASERLSNAVLYLLLSQSTSNKLNQRQKSFRAELVTQLTENLMVHGAKVYFIDDQSKTQAEKTTQELVSSAEKPIGALNQLSGYVDEINKRYLSNSSKYQRVLVIDIDESLSDFDKKQMVVYHHGSNTKGEAFAKHIIEVLHNNGLTENDVQKPEVLLDKRNLYLARNVLPPISLIQIKNELKVNGIKRLDKNKFSGIIATAVLADYEDLNEGN